MNRPGFEGWKQQEFPLPEQLDELIELLRETVHMTGRGTKNRVSYKEVDGRIVAQVPSGELLAPGDVTDWSIPDSDAKIEIRRYRNTVGLYRTLGAGAGKLVMAETDATRIDVAGEEKYHMLRTTHIFAWNSLQGIYEARRNPIEIISRPTVDVEVLPRQEFFAPDKLMMSTERTAPSERFDFGWQPATEVDVDMLLRRVHEYQRDLVDIQDQRAS